MAEADVIIAGRVTNRRLDASSVSSTNRDRAAFPGGTARWSSRSPPGTAPFWIGCVPGLPHALANGPG